MMKALLEPALDDFSHMKISDNVIEQAFEIVSKFERRTCKKILAIAKK